MSVTRWGPPFLLLVTLLGCAGPPDAADGPQPDAAAAPDDPADTDPTDTDPRPPAAPDGRDGPDGPDAPADATPDPDADRGSDQPSPDDPEPALPAELAGVVTEDDHGTTFAATVGDRVAVRLGHAWRWAEPQVAGGAVSLTPVHHESDPGFTEWELTATDTGRATVTIAGEPNCPDTGSCPARTVELHVVVEA